VARGDADAPVEVDSGSRRKQAEHRPAPARLSRPHAGQTMTAHCRRGAAPRDGVSTPARGRAYFSETIVSWTDPSLIRMRRM